MKIQLQISAIFLLILNGLLLCQAFRHYTFVVRNASYTRLCSTKNILTVNGQFPGPTLHVTKGETIFVNVYNRANYNITLHWHGVKQPRYPWSDGPEYITQCPIRPGGKFSQRVIFSTEEGTLWWHAHSDYSRATVHGAIVVRPKPGTTYPFPKPHAEFPIVLGEWWKSDIAEIYNEFRRSGQDPNVSDAFTINGQPGDLYPCSKPDTFKMKVEQGKTYLLRLVNAALENNMFFGIAKHNLTVVAADASYTKPLTQPYITIYPGQTMDVLLLANQPLLQNCHYYIAAKAYHSAEGVSFDNTTTTAILEYSQTKKNSSCSKIPIMPSLPSYNNTNASTNIISNLRSLNDKNHRIRVPLNITTPLFFTTSINSLSCDTCEDGTRTRASVNNISLELPSGSNILKAYYENVSGVYYREGFPDVPPYVFDFTGEDLPAVLQTPTVDTKVRVLELGSMVEIVLQGTNLLAGTEHPMHLHGHSFYVVGWGFGNFNKTKDPLKYNLVDPPKINTIAVPKNGWATIRFRASNPGVWFVHCHLERHLSWGMAMTFIIKNGKGPEEQLLPPPRHMPKCY